MPNTGLILANRAYLDHEAPRWADSPSSAGNGGLLAAVRPVIEPWDGEQGTTWIGAGLGRHDREWTDERGFELIETPRGPLRHRRLYFGDHAWHGHYAEVSNSFLWPLFHLVRDDLPARTSYYPAPVPPSPADWASFLAVNTAFAEAAADETGKGWCWVQDYQLALVPGLLRRGGFRGRIGFFLHIPFPDTDVARPYLGDARGTALAEVVRGMLGADLLGFQTPADVERFQRAAVQYAGARASEGNVFYEGRVVSTGAFPVGIDIEDVLEVARRAKPSPRVLAARAHGLPIVVGLERGDFTKGIPERLRAITSAFRAGERFAYLGIASPTREGVRAYEALDIAMDQAASQASAAARSAGGSFAHVRANVGWDDVVALQRDADVVFTSSLSDGQNLVPLQAAVAQSLRPASERAVIITGQDAGAASTYGEFRDQGLTIVDPLVPEAMLGALRNAIHGRPGRVSDKFIDEVCRRDARAWATGFLGALEASC